jgi:hypothetical protein
MVVLDEALVSYLAGLLEDETTSFDDFEEISEPIIADATKWDEAKVKAEVARMWKEKRGDGTEGAKEKEPTKLEKPVMIANEVSNSMKQTQL